MPTPPPLAYGQGFCNLFLAVVSVVGIVVVTADRHAAGWALVLSGCGSLLAVVIGALAA